DVDAALARSDYSTALQALEQLIVAAPNNDGTPWLRLARTIMNSTGADDRDRHALLERASTAAYIAYQHATTREQEADSLRALSPSFADRKLWRPALDSLRLSLELREDANVRVTYEQMRKDYGFRLIDYTVDADAASPRACFQFSEALPARRTDFSPFV